MSSAAVLIVPACEKGRGGGHFNRSLLLLRRLNELMQEAYLWIPENLKDDFLQRVRDFFEDDDRRFFLSREEELKSRTWDLIVIDQFRTTAEEFAFWHGLAPLIGIDEGGPSRRCFDFLVDLLPSLARSQPNLSAPGLLPLPKNRRLLAAENQPAKKPKSRTLKILISFGAEDSAGLGFSAARDLSHVIERNSAAEPANPPEITLIAPCNGSSGEAEELSGVKIIRSIPNLRESLAEYDLFITHFGLGAFEAVYARVPVLLISPTFYHDKLSRHTGFHSLGIGKRSLLRNRVYHLVCFTDGDFVNFLKGTGENIARRFGLDEEQKEDLGTFIAGLRLHSPRSCPVCGNAGSKYGMPVLARFAEDTYRRCPACGIISLSRLKPAPIEYEKDYFFDFYKKQYGKTYLEDFSNLKEMGRRRLVHIMELINLMPKKADVRPCLLDIGCAYGPFLAAAAECGFSPAGIEPAQDAVRYIKEELGFPCWHGFFPDALSNNALSKNVLGEALPAAEDPRFDAVTLWYVIEHFQEPGKVLEEIYRLLKDGGVLAFSTPSFSGVSAGGLPQTFGLTVPGFGFGRKFLRSFLEKSPQDHWTVWTPGSCKKIFRQYGFKLRKIAVTGHHPERFPFLGRFVTADKESLLYRLLLLISRLFRLGDTFEAYGVKAES